MPPCDSEIISHHKYDYYMPPCDSAITIHKRCNYFIPPYDSCTFNTKLGHFSETLKENQIVPILTGTNTTETAVEVLHLTTI